MFNHQLIINLILILAAAWFMGRIFARFGLPVVLGELLAGLILGPPLLGIVNASAPIELLAELGIFFLMFHAGLEMDPKEALEHLWSSIAVALGGFIIPFFLGFFTCLMFGGSMYQSLFVGMGLSITAIAVQARVLHDLKIQNTSIGRIIIGAAIVDDILALVTLSILLNLAESGEIQAIQISFVIFKVITFFAITILIGQFLIPKFIKKLDDREAKAFTFALLSALVVGFLAEFAGLHLIIGAFLAGQLVRKEIIGKGLYQKINDRFYSLSYGFMAPIFFVSLSFHLHFQWKWHFIIFALTITLIATIGKLIGCGAGAILCGQRIWGSAIIGCGMNGRGAVEMVVATVIIKMSDELIASNTITEPLLTQNQFSALIFMAFITTILAPLTMKWAVKKYYTCDENAHSYRLLEECKKNLNKLIVGIHE